ncbi:MAG: tetratricopeptide repeat protein [Pirellulaceae bacterium]|nr:tetratricopeptide repeat protein [Pirellulaceae bacterium]
MGRLLKLLLIGLGGSAMIIFVAVLLTPLSDVEEDSVGAVGQPVDMQPAADAPKSEDTGDVNVPLVQPKPTLSLPEVAKETPTKQLQDEIRAAAAELTELFPGDAASWHVAAQVEFELLQSEKAEEYWNKCLSLEPKHFGPYLGMADLLTSKGRFEDAIIVLKKVFALGGSAPEVYLKLGEAYENQGMLADALETFTLGSQAFPDDADLLAGLGRLQSQSNLLPEAESNLKRAIAIRGETQQLLSSLVVVLMRQEKRDEAGALRKNLQQLVSKTPSNPTSNDSAFQRAYDAALRQSAYRIFESCGSALYQNRRIDLAEKYFLRAVQQDPKIVSGWVGLSETLLKQQKYADVMQVMKRIIDLEPEDPIYQINLASVELKLNDFQAAEATLKKALTLKDENSALAQIALAKLYLSSRRFELAHQAVDVVLASAPAPEVAQLKAEIYRAEGKPEQAAELLKSMRITTP